MEELPIMTKFIITQTATNTKEWKDARSTDICFDNENGDKYEGYGKKVNARTRVFTYASGNIYDGNWEDARSTDTVFGLRQTATNTKVIGKR